MDAVSIKAECKFYGNYGLENADWRDRYATTKKYRATVFFFKVCRAVSNFNQLIRLLQLKLIIWLWKIYYFMIYFKLITKVILFTIINYTKLCTYRYKLIGTILYICRIALVLLIRYTFLSINIALYSVKCEKYRKYIRQLN